MELKSLLQTLCAALGVSGMENSEAAGVAAELMKPLGRTEITPMGSVICTVREPKEGEPHLMLNAHIDQIGLIVTYIDDKGFLKVSSCGGIDRRLLLASQVTVHGKEKLKGVVCSVPPHLQEGEAKNQKVTEVAIDIGMTKERAEQFVRLGDRITIDGDFLELRGGLVTSPALDDRAGCAAVIYAAQMLKDSELSCGITIALSAQEETSGIGAATAAYKVNPTHALVCDVSFGNSPDLKKHEYGVLGKGCMVCYAASLNHSMSECLASIAKEQSIPFQIEVSGAKTSTDADTIARTRGGVVTGLISIPQRFMHTPVETVSMEDVESVATLMAAYAKQLKKEG